MQSDHIEASALPCYLALLTSDHKVQGQNFIDGGIQLM